jgi:hypothetical protein
MGIHGQSITLVAHAQRDGSGWQRGRSQCGGEHGKREFPIDVHKCLLWGLK